MKYAFITGMGRSGTKFLSSLLALDKDVFSTHEFIGNREFWLVSWYLGKIYSLPFLIKEKQKIVNNINKDLFIDVNSYLSDSVESLQEVFEDATMFHLVRNPKNVVPSLMTRRNDKRIHKIPKNQDAVKDWITMNKLEQICANWVQTTEDLLKSEATLLKFESVISNYQYLSKNLLKPLNINISKDDFNQFKSKKINKTRGFVYRYLYAKYKGKHFVNKNFTFQDFSEKEKETFYKICEPTMEKLNYK